MDEREAVLAETGLGRDEAKQAFITLMYGGERKDPTPFMAEFREEFLTNATAVLASEAYERYRTLAEAKKPANVLGCGISFVAQDLERQLVCCAYPNPSEQGLRGGDDHSRRVPGTEPHGEGPGPQGRRRSRETDARLRGSVRQEEPRGLRRERPLGSHRRGRRRRGRREPHGSGEGVLGVARGSRAPPRPRREEDVLVRPGARRVPREREASSGEEVHERVPCFAEGEPRRDGVPVETHRANRGVSLEDDSAFHDKIIDTTLRKIPFSNGVYCCETQRLVDYDADMYFLEKGSVEYDPQSEALKAEVYQRAFLDVFGTEEIARYVLRSLARAMAGETEDKVFFIVKGRTNSGKGLLTLLISKAFFGKFGNINATNFCQKRTDGDMAKMDSWKCQTRHKRSAWPTRRPRRGDAASTATPSRGPRGGTITRRGPTAWTR